MNNFKNILLTGSGGFIGKNLKQFLQVKYNLLCPRSFELDLTNNEAVKNYFNKNNIDFIIHCGSTGGARGIDDKNSTIEDNLAMVNNLTEYKKSTTKIILFGSGAMYGKDRPLCKVKESAIGNYIPKDLYGISKMKIAEIVKQRNDILMLNIFACYGYDEKESRFPSYAINQVLKGKDITINQNVVFDYLWVEDMQKIINHFITNPTVSDIINITPTQSCSLKEIAETINNFTDKKVKIIIKNTQMNNEYTGDNSKLLNEIRDFKFTSLEIGLKKLYEYNKNLMQS